PLPAEPRDAGEGQGRDLDRAGHRWGPLSERRPEKAWHDVLARMRRRRVAPGRSERMTTMRPDQVQRYARHILLPDVGGVGPKRLFGGAVLVGDLGGAAEAAVAYLAAAGVGTLVVRDRGLVEAPGFLFENADVGRPRIDAVRERVAALNPDVTVAAEGEGL